MELRKLIKLKNETKEMSCSEVYEQFRKFIYKTANSFPNYNESVEDLIQVANIGLIKAFNAYKVESNNLFMTYMGRVVFNEIFMYLRHIKRKNKSNDVLSLETVVATDSDGNTITLSDYLMEPTNYEELAISHIAGINLKKIVNELKPKNKKVIELFYFDDMVQSLIGEELNLSQTYVSRLIKKTLKILKTKYETN